MVLALLLALQGSATERLGADEADLRAGAEREILERGIEAVPELVRALRHADPEVRARSGDLLVRLRPVDWIVNHLDDPVAQGLFHACHKLHLRDRWEHVLFRFLEANAPGETPLPRLEESAASSRIVLWRQGSLRRADLPLDRIRLVMNEGAIVAGAPSELDSSKPFCRLLLERLLEDPRDARAACLLADAIPADMLPALSRALDRRDRIGELATRVFLFVHAKNPMLDPEERLIERLSPLVTGADRNLVSPLSAIAVKHPHAFEEALRLAYRSPSRWSRYLAAAVANRTQDPCLYDPGLFEAMREPVPELQRQALFASFGIAPRDELDFDAMLEAALALEDDLDEDVLDGSARERGAAVSRFREILDADLGLALVRMLPRERRFALAILDTPELIEHDRVAEAFSAEAERVPSPDYLQLLLRYAARGRRSRPVDALKAGFERLDEPGGVEAAVCLAGALGEEGLPFFEAALQDGRPTIRRRALEGLRAVNLHLRPGTPGFALIAEIVIRAAEAETEAQTSELAAAVLQLLEGPPPPMPEAEAALDFSFRGRPVRLGCRSLSTGWEPTVVPAVPLPDWK